MESCDKWGRCNKRCWNQPWDPWQITFLNLLYWNALCIWWIHPSWVYKCVHPCNHCSRTFPSPGKLSLLFHHHTCTDLISITIEVLLFFHCRVFHLQKRHSHTCVGAWGEVCTRRLPVGQLRICRSGCLCVRTCPRPVLSPYLLAGQHVLHSFTRWDAGSVELVRNFYQRDFHGVRRERKEWVPRLWLNLEEIKGKGFVVHSGACFGFPSRVW